MEILIATGNKGKVREYATLLADLPITLLSLDDVGLGDMDVDETGETFEANAELKARAYAAASGKTTLADDSGLCVHVLDNAPGVLSARYGGAGLDDKGRRDKLLDALQAVPDGQRTAHFECVIAVFDPQREASIIARGKCNGQITRADEDGGEGFGYDAIFMPDAYNKTFAQLTKDIKNTLSHRGEAVKSLIPILKSLYG